MAAQGLIESSPEPNAAAAEHLPPARRKLILSSR